jgi:hypothetical protein
VKRHKVPATDYACNTLAIVFAEILCAPHAGGDFTTAGGVKVYDIAQWDGTQWSRLGSGLDSWSVSSLAVDTTGRLYVGGWFTTAGGKPSRFIGRWE